jgi:ABC-type branched-subunit amino acid transport system substrate-binding protein
MRWLRTPKVLALAAVGLTLAACGSSSTSATSSGGNSSYTIMGFFPLTGTQGLYTQWANTFKATVAQINASGGVKGHHLKPILCDTGISANGAIACGREAVADKAFGVVDFSESGAYEPLLQQAGIPDLNDLTDPAFYNNPVSFPVFPGGAVFFAGFVGTAHHIGCTKMTLVNAFPETAAQVDAENAAIATAGQALHVTVTSPVLVSSTAVDMSSPVAQALANKPGCIAVQSAGSDTDGIIEAAHSSDPSVKLITGEGFIAPGQFASLPPALAASIDIFDTSLQETSTTTAGVREWLQTVNKYSASPQAFNSDGATIWTATKVLAQAASNVSVVNAKNVDAYLNANHTFSYGVLPAVNFTKPVTPNPVGKRIFDACVIRVQYTNAKYYNVGQFYNVFSGQTCNV